MAKAKVRKLTTMEEDAWWHELDNIHAGIAKLREQIARDNERQPTQTDTERYYTYHPREGDRHD